MLYYPLVQLKYPGSSPMTQEKWQTIPGFEGKYEASDQGRVRSVDRRVRLVVHGVETTRLARGCVLRPAPSPLGHLTVVLGRGNTASVHAVVALTFIGPRPQGLDVAHNDGNPANNRVENLRYASRSSNNRDKITHGRTKLSVSDVQRIRAVHKEGKRGRKTGIAKELGVSPSTVSDVIAGRTYDYV